MRLESMTIKSTAFPEGGMIPAKFTCDGEGISPELVIANTDENAKSLVLIVDDPDAPMGNFNHWVMWNIPPRLSKIEENSQPSGSVSGVNSGERNGYIGPCPPGGTHRYYFKLYALDTVLDLDPSSRKDDVEKAIEDHIITEAELLGKYTKH